jgi:hypothetical protein
VSGYGRKRRVGMPECTVMLLSEQTGGFVRRSLVDVNVTQATTRAGYSAKTANEQGAHLLANVGVQEGVHESMKSREQRRSGLGIRKRRPVDLQDRRDPETRDANGSSRR